MKEELITYTVEVEGDSYVMESEKRRAV